MRNMKLIGLPLLAVVVYMLLGGVFLRLGLNPIVSTLITDLVAFGLSFWYLWGKPVPVDGDGRSLLQAPAKPVLWIGMALVWVFGQITASWVLVQTGDPSFQTYHSELNDVTGVMMWLSLLLTVVAAPLCEEFLIRGVVFGTWRKVNPWFAFFGSSLLFAFLHGTLTHLVPTFLTGMLLAVAYAVTGRIWFTVVLHIGYNLGASLLGGISLPAVLFEPWAFITVDVLLFVWLCLEFRHALKSDVTYEVAGNVSEPLGIAKRIRRRKGDGSDGETKEAPHVEDVDA